MVGKQVLLIRPKSVLKSYAGFYPPLSLVSLAGVLEKNGYVVKILDAVAEQNFYRKLNEELKKSFVVGITALTSEIMDAINILKFVKKNSDLPTVMGGWHVTLFPEQTCNDELVDFVITHEGEISFYKLVDALCHKKSYKKIPGLVFKEKSVVKKNPHEIVDMEILPMPAYHLVDMEKYVSETILDGKRIRWFPYQSTRGCPHKCSFCINPVVGNYRYRAKSIEKTIEEIKYLINKCKINGILFIDDNFFVNRARVLELCKRFRELNIKWFAECRADYFRKGHVDDDVLSKCKEAGLFSFTIGAESGSPKILEKMCKNITIEQIINSARQCAKHKIIPDYSFIIGLPGEKKEDVLMTLALIKRLKKIVPYMTGGVNTYRPYPKTELTLEAAKYGFREPEKFKEWTDKKNSLMFSERTYPQPWQIDSKYVNSVSFFGTIYLSGSSDEKLRLKDIPDRLFRSIANFRVKTGFFSFPLDMELYNLYSALKKKLYIRLKSKN